MAPPGVRLGPGPISDMRPLAGEKSAGIPPSLRPSGRGRRFPRLVWGLSVACTPPRAVSSPSQEWVFFLQAPPNSAQELTSDRACSGAWLARRGVRTESGFLDFQGTCGGSRPGRVTLCLKPVFVKWRLLKTSWFLWGQGSVLLNVFK